MVGFHDIKGQGIYAYVTLKAGIEGIKSSMKTFENCKSLISPIASLRKFNGPYLPKTRSGKIMRRILRKIAANETEELEILVRWQTLVLWMS